MTVQELDALNKTTGAILESIAAVPGNNKMAVMEAVTIMWGAPELPATPIKPGTKTMTDPDTGKKYNLAFKDEVRPTDELRYSDTTPWLPAGGMERRPRVHGIQYRREVKSRKS